MTTGGRHWYTALYVQVLIAVVLGALVGWLFPAFATNDWVEFLGRGFVKLVKMALAPLIFCTVVSGIALCMLTYIVTMEIRISHQLTLRSPTK